MKVQFVGEMTRKGAEDFIVAEDGRVFSLPTAVKSWDIYTTAFLEGEAVGQTILSCEVCEFMTAAQLRECASFYRSRYRAGALKKAMQRLADTRETAARWQWQRIISLLEDRSTTSTVF